MSAQPTPPKIDDGVRIVPVVERVICRGFVPWPTVPIPGNEYVAVEALPGMTDPEFGFVMAEWLKVRDYAPGTTVGQVLSRILEDEMETSHLFPGLRVVGNDGRAITSGCCCCLGDWREWLDVPEGGHAWLGHDPSPGLNLQGDLISVWSDGDLEDQTQAFEILIPVDHYVQELERMRLGLVELGERIEAWLVPSVGREIAIRIHQKFDRDFSVSRDFREEHDQYDEMRLTQQ